MQSSNRLKAGKVTPTALGYRLVPLTFMYFRAATQTTAGRLDVWDSFWDREIGIVGKVLVNQARINLLSLSVCLCLSLSPKIEVKIWGKDCEFLKEVNLIAYWEGYDIIR